MIFLNVNKTVSSMHLKIFGNAICVHYVHAHAHNLHKHNASVYIWQ